MSPPKDSIFVQIASYRDRDLPNTIWSALNNASHPDRIRFGICWQYDEQTYTDLDPFIRNPAFRISQHYYEESLGCCWARNITNSLFQGETYTLQIDAHSRFSSGWDSEYIKMFNGVKSEKPLFSTYPAPFTIVNGVDQLVTDRGIQKLVLGKIRKNLSTMLKTAPAESSEYCVPSHFIAAGQIFTLGEFCEEVEYDPHFYFDGEEISLAARAYTYGYDFFCPNKDLVWHLYKHTMPLHWSDHENRRNEIAMERLSQLLLGEHDKLGKYGLGNTRTIREFEDYIGINFRERTLRQNVPTRFKQAIELDVSKIPDRNDYDYWIFTLKNIDEKEIYRFDIRDERVLQKAIQRVELDVQLEDMPISYSLWPYVPSMGYLEQHHREL